MKKFLPIVLILIIIGIGAYLFLSRGKLTFTGKDINVSKKITNKSETFVGDLKAAVLKGIPFKCTVTQEDMTGTAYIKNKKYYGEIKKAGKENYIILTDNCMWVWEKGRSQGIKSCAQEDIWEKEGTGRPEGQVSCTMSQVDDSLFIPPASVNFIDVGNLPQQ